MAFAPLLDSPAVFRAPEVVLVLRPLLPATLTLRFALFAAARLRAGALIPQVASIGTIKLFAAKAFAPGGTLHWANSKNGSGPYCKTLPPDPPIRAINEQNRRTQNKTKKSFILSRGTKITDHS